jgi:hypothetical protein
MSEWSVEQTDDIQEVDEKKKPAAEAPFQKPKRDKNGHALPGQEMGSSGEHEEEPDKDKEAAP